MSNLDVTERVRLSLLTCCLLGCGFLAVHIIQPGNPAYVGGTVVLSAVAVVTFAWANKSPQRALQTFWWIVLAVVGLMVIVDAPVHAQDGLPIVVAVPPIGVILFKLWSSVRASTLYSLGVVALLVPAGMVYGQWDQLAVLIGIVALVISAKRPTSTDDAVLAALLGMEDQAQRVLDEINGCP